MQTSIDTLVKERDLPSQICVYELSCASKIKSVEKLMSLQQ